MSRYRLDPQWREYYGWAWRGANLSPEEIAAYIPGLLLKHLGEGRACSGEVQDFPVIFWIYAWEGCRGSALVEDVAFPEDTCFRVVTVKPIPGHRVAIFLEQDSSACGQEGVVEDGNLEKCATLSHQLPPPSPELAKAWLAPFARWAPDAQPGDVPLLGLIYQAREAALFAAKWAGTRAEHAERILESKGRFKRLTEIVEIAGYSVHEAYFNERIAHHFLLPECPGTFSERENGFVSMATGHEKKVVASVIEGEAIYRDTLHVIQIGQDLEAKPEYQFRKWPEADRDASRLDLDRPSPIFPECRSFVLHYSVSPSYEGYYSVRIEVEEGACSMSVVNSPMAMPCPSDHWFHSPERHLPESEADHLLGVIKDVRITSSGYQAAEMDATIFRLHISNHGITNNLQWYSTLPTGWGGLQPLVGLLERYALRYGRKPRLENPGPRPNPRPSLS